MEQTKTTFGINSISQPAPRWLYIIVVVITALLGSVVLWANETTLLTAVAKKEVLLVAGAIQAAITLISPLIGIKKQPVYKS